MALAFATTLVLVSCVVHMGFASRKKFNKNDYMLEINDDAMKSCPSEVAENPRGDCIDADANEIVPSHCCDDLRWCNKKVPEFFDSYAAKIESYYVNCGLMGNDVVSEGAGKFAVVDTTRVCSPQCQNFPGLHDGALPDYVPLENKCADQELLPKLKEQNNFISVLNDAFFACTTTSTTNTLPTTLSTTTTRVTLPYFDFTEFFGGAQADRGADALFPNYVRYHCCCNPDKNRNAVHCVLKKAGAESIPELFRSLVWSGCGGSMGGNYHAWNKVDTTTHTGFIRSEFEGLEHRGKCVVQNDELPTFLRVKSHTEIKEYLDNFR